MAYLQCFRFWAVGLVGAALTLGGCCANDVCKPDDPLADAINLRFSSKFAVNDLDTVIIQRYPKKFTASTRPETVTLIRASAQPGDSVLLVVLNNETPFGRVGTTNVGAYRYVVQYLPHPGGAVKPVLTTALVIDSLRVQGNYFKASACCTNYRNTGKTVYLQGKAVDLTRMPALVLPR